MNPKISMDAKICGVDLYWYLSKRIDEFSKTGIGLTGDFDKHDAIKAAVFNEASCYAIYVMFMIVSPHIPKAEPDSFTTTYVLAFYDQIALFNDKFNRIRLNDLVMQRFKDYAEADAKYKKDEKICDKGSRPHPGAMKRWCEILDETLGHQKANELSPLALSSELTVYVESQTRRFNESNAKA